MDDLARKAQVLRRQSSELTTRFRRLVEERRRIQEQLAVIEDDPLPHPDPSRKLSH
jgi:hypothetical protein